MHGETVKKKKKCLLCDAVGYKVKLLKCQYLVLVSKIALKLYSIGISAYVHTHTHTHTPLHLDI
jgi:hypothetical protein